MFSLYKNIISNNFYDHINGKSPLFDYSIKLDFKLFELPILPHIPAPAYGNDSLFCPYEKCYIEGYVDCAEFSLNEYLRKNNYELRGAFVFRWAPDEESRREHDFLSETSSVLTVDFFAKDDTNEIAHLPFDLHCCISKEANLLYIKETLAFKGGSELEKQQSTRYMKSYEIWVLDFLRFINLSNIKIESEVMSRKDTKFYNQRKTNHTYYHVLKVKKPTFTKKAIKSSGEKALKPLHQVRGHLADYTQGKGLFGKYNIRIWVPEHWRGDLQYGEIKKDYKLKNEL